MIIGDGDGEMMWLCSAFFSFLHRDESAHPVRVSVHFPPCNSTGIAATQWLVQSSILSTLHPS